MNDSDTIKDAYKDTLQKLFSFFYDSYAIAQSQTDKDAALQRFQNGVAAARAARDKALSVL